MPAQLPPQVGAYLGGHHVMTLATHGAGGPWAAAVFYVSDGYTLYFLSSPRSRHARDVAAEPRVAATVQEDYAEWSQIRGVQLEGRVRELAGDEAERARVERAMQLVHRVGFVQLADRLGREQSTGHCALVGVSGTPSGEVAGTVAEVALPR